MVDLHLRAALVAGILFFLLLTGATCEAIIYDYEEGIVVEKDIFSGRASRISGDSPDQYTLLLDDGEGHTFIVSLGDSLWAYSEWQRIQIGYFCKRGSKKGFTQWSCDGYPN